MRIEILVDGSVEPQIYPLNKPKLVLGSGETCDVIISSENISRKHLIIVNDGDSYYVIDQGSTNGSFINEERLVPGRRTEFTSFFPVRLGTDVLISLLSDDEMETSSESPLIPLNIPEEDRKARGGDESTKMISLADLKKAKTTDLQAKRQEGIKKRATAAKAPVKKTKRQAEKQNFKFLQWVVLLALGGIGYYNYQSQSEERAVRKMGEVDPNQVVRARPVEVKKAPSPTEAQLIPDEQLTEKEKYTQFMNDAKCITDVEKYLCEKLPGANSGKAGVVQVGTTFHILIDGDAFIREARETVVHPPADAQGNYPPEIYEPYKKTVMDTALAIYFMRGIPKDFDWEKYKDAKFSFAILETWQGQTYVQRVAAGYSESFRKFQGIVSEEFIKNVKDIGDNALLFTKDYYKTY